MGNDELLSLKDLEMGQEMQFTRNSNQGTLQRSKLTEEGTFEEGGKKKVDLIN